MSTTIWLDPMPKGRGLRQRHVQKLSETYYPKAGRGTLSMVAKRLRDQAARITELDAQRSDLHKLHNALSANQSIWPNNWNQQVAMIAYHFHLIRTQLEATKQANQWQPIDTAPKDGKQA